MLISAIVALVFGILTIFSGGQALFGDQAARSAVGTIVPFVLWFNFLAGFVYVVAAIGLIRRRRWSVWVSTLIAVSTIIVFGALGLFIWSGGSYEGRTVGAMALRSGVWVVIAMVAWRTFRGSSFRSDS